MSPAKKGMAMSMRQEQRNIKNKLFWAFVIIVLVQTLFLVYMIANRQYILNAGKTILLETVPVDPRSLFSGEYVRLRYKISDISLNEMAGDKNFKRGDDVYVILQSAGSDGNKQTSEVTQSFWQPVAISKTYPKSIAANQIVIHGIANGRNFLPLDNNLNQKIILSIWYGIEQYYMPEGNALALERASQNKSLSVQVKVDSFGRAAILALQP